MQLWDAAFLFIATSLDAILKFDFFFFFQKIHDAVFELARSDKPEEDSKDSKNNKRSELFGKI